MSNGSQLIRNDMVRKEIYRLKAELANGIMLDARQILQKYTLILRLQILQILLILLKLRQNQLKQQLNLTQMVQRNPRKQKFYHIRTRSLLCTIQKKFMGHSLPNYLKVKTGCSKLNLQIKWQPLRCYQNTQIYLLNDEQLKRLREEKLKVDIAKVCSETKGAGGRNTTGIDLSNLTMEELGVIANSKR
ncbi:hypothetical protein [Lysinibacillus sp. NPDC047702]|uniref:hypothetical protein n=1 Tax=unclassified Lysinibacillus TaxID=2636778 RepID=UPI003D04AB49